jgi:pimeloyl-ACP methyl ester carboxylesterase
MTSGRAAERTAEIVTLPETRYTRAGDVDIAYATLGEGPDLVWVYGMMTHLEVKWEEPAVASMLRRLAEFSRLILFDRRGCGLSARGDRHLAPTLDERVEDIVAVLDAVGSSRASLLGVSEGCGLAAMFALTHPQRTERIVLYGPMSRVLKDEAHPWGLMELPEVMAAWGPVFDEWGTLAGAEAQVRLIAPSMAGDEDYLRWFARQQGHSLSRDAVVAFMTAIAEYDMDSLFPAVRVPALVLHRHDDSLVPLDVARRLASRIHGATLLELPGSDHLPYVGDSDAVVDAVRQFLAGTAAPAPLDRQLMTILAADATAPTERALVRRHLRRSEGVEVRGDDRTMMARFGSATRAVRCGLGIAEAVHEPRGTRLRVGVHTGECETSATTVRGPAARVPEALVSVAGPGQVVVSGTVRDVVPGSGIRFTDERRVHLPGLPGEHTVLTVVSPSEPAAGGAAEGGQREDADSLVFRLDGEYWLLAFEGRVVRLHDSKGMHDLAQLLADPGRERHVLDLWTGVAGTRDLHHGSDLVLDDEGRRRFRQKLGDLEAEIADAERRGEPVAAAAAREERDRLVEALASAYGLEGRGRRIPDEVERARKAIRRRVVDAFHRIEKAHPSLGRHLRHSVHTGVYCSYVPERDLRWDTGALRGRPAGGQLSTS